MNAAASDETTIGDLTSADPHRQIDAIAQIAAAPNSRLTDQALGALVRCVGAPAKAVRRRAADALAALARTGDDRVAPALRIVLADSARPMRWGAAYALAQIGGAFGIDAAPAVLEALSDADGDIRWAAADLVVRLGRENPEVMRKHLLRIARAGDANARKMALYSIRDLGWSGEDVLDVLNPIIADANPHLRLAALAVLARLDHPRDGAIRIVRRCLESDPAPGVRRAAAAALDKLEKR